MELTDKKYHLLARTKFVEKTVIEEELKTQYVRRMVILIPDLNDEAMRFFRAWLPETTEDYYEVVAELGAPVHSPCRLSVHRKPHPYSNDYHFLFVMTKGVEDDLLQFPQGTRIQLTVLSQDSDEAADFAKDSDDGNYQLVEV